MGSVVQQEYWDQFYRRTGLESYPGDVPVQFKELFARHLPRGGTCFEVGCYPGPYLIHLGREFGYTVSGIDLTPDVVNLGEHVARHGVAVGAFYHGDFLTF